MVTVMAALFATTGEILTQPAETAFLSGPYLVTHSNLPSESLQICSGDGFPVCPNTLTPFGDEATCACTNRKDIKIVAVTHAEKDDFFWDNLFAGFYQAAADFGVTFETARFDPTTFSSTTIEEQILTIQNTCQQELDDSLDSPPRFNYTPPPSQEEPPPTKVARTRNALITTAGSGQSIKVTEEGMKRAESVLQEQPSTNSESPIETTTPVFVLKSNTARPTPKANTKTPAAVVTVKKALLLKLLYLVLTRHPLPNKHLLPRRLLMQPC